MTLNVPTYVGLESGKTLLDGLNVQNAINENRLRTNQSLTALGTTQITGFQCQGDLSNFTTVAANTVCCLPPANPGRQHIILNNGANTLKIYPYGGVGAASVDTTTSSGRFASVRAACGEHDPENAATTELDQSHRAGRERR